MPMTRLGRIAALVALAALVTSSCGGRAPVYERAGTAPAPGLALPDPLPADPAYVARLRPPTSARNIDDVKEIEGVAAAGAVRVRRLPVHGPAGPGTLRVASVDPLAFRPLALPATRDAEFVWASLLAGEAVATFAAAETLGIDGPAPVTVGGKSLEITALADMGALDLADIVVADFVGDELRLGRPKVLVVGARTGASIDALARPLRRALPGARVARIPTGDSGAAPRPRSVGPASSGQVLAAMSYRVLPDGFIEPDPAWIQANIATARVPVLGAVTCHRTLLPQLAAALGEIERRGLAGEIYQYGGCYVPRFIDRDPSRSLSLHAFGLAVDLNVPSNALGTRGDMHPEVVAIFARWGFAWGGHWSEPDPMHFELARLVQT